MNRWLIIAVSCCMAAVGPVEALSVSPGRTEMRAAPGERLKASVSLLNESTARQHITISTKDWFVLPENQSWTVDRWLTVKGHKDFWLKPGESRTVPVLVTCPKDAQGELVAMVSFTYVGEVPSMVTPMISVSMYLAVTGHEKVEGEIKEIAIDNWHKQFRVGVSVRSTGNVHLRPTGQVAIQDVHGQQVVLLPIREGDPAYPGQVRGYRCTMPVDFKLSAGRYSAHADLQYRDLKMSSARNFEVSKDDKILLTDPPASGATSS